MRIAKIFGLRATAFVLLVAIVGCHSARKRDAEAEIVPSEREKKLGLQLEKNLSREFGDWDDSVVRKVLQELADKLVAGDPKYRAEVTGVKVKLLGTKESYVAAGLDKVIFVSRGILGHISYENELAVLMGTQIALMKENVPARNFAALQGEELGENLIKLPTAPPSLAKDYLAGGWFEAGGLFDFGQDAYLKAEREGIRLAYLSGYDPRGAVTLIQRWLTGPDASYLRSVGKILPEAEDRLRAAREEVAKLSPLRDPIVRTQAFEELMSRVHIKKAKHKKKP